jgi:hypothetical protein
MGFLENFFTMVEFPRALHEEVVMDYRHQYGNSLARNDSVADSAGALIGYTDQGGAAWLASTPSSSVLDALLDSDERRYAVLDRLLQHWKLGERDQMRLIARPVGARIADRILVGAAFSNEVRDAVMENASQRGRATYQKISAELREAVERRGKVEVNSRYLERAGRGGTRVTGEHLLETMNRALTLSIRMLSGNDGESERLVGSLSGVLIERLGDGTREDDFARWRIFIDLAGTEPELTAVQVAETAALLVDVEEAEGLSTRRGRI